MLFPINVDKGATSRPSRPRLLIADFGDGYSQAMPDGLNHNLKRWTLTISRRPAGQIRAALAFLEERAGVYPFEFECPFDGLLYSVRCREWEPQLDGESILGLSAVFEQVP